MSKKTTSYSKYATITLDAALDKSLDYGIPESLLPKVQCGIRVSVPVRGRLCSGYITELKDTCPYLSVRPIADVLSDETILTKDLLQLANWIASYYGAPLRKVLKGMVPASIRKGTKPKEQLFVKRKKGRQELQKLCAEIRPRYPAQAAVLDVLLKVKQGILLSELLEKTKGSRSPVDTLAKKEAISLQTVAIDRSPLEEADYFRSQPKTLHQEQKDSYDKICQTLEKGAFATHLLHGVTGSGKTEIYMQAIEKTLSLGKGAIMLLPEISLTTQMIERFCSRFDKQIAVLHHRLSDGERLDEWKRIRQGKANIVIGARSAVFSPIQNLGLIIIDEEHEASYKQSEEAPCYHARDVAVMRCKFTDSTCILGSATPCLESYLNASSGKYQLSTLHARADQASKPKVTIIDMKQAFEKAKGFTLFSDPLLTAIKKRFDQGEQSILFLNRRGYHTSLLCRSCGESIGCSQCDVSLTYHKNKNILSCHLCGHAETPPRNCPSCQGDQTLKYKGVGTEMVERSLHAIFPDIRTLRVDADTTRHKGSHQKLLRDFKTGKADVMIGTQMIAKGLHFPEVTLVGVLNCDMTLNIPDFRASETAFQLITQVAGRSGRGVIPGEVLIQTFIPDNNTIQHASNQDFLSFYKEEIEIRKMFQYPPFIRLAKIVLSGPEEKKVIQSAERMHRLLIQSLPPSFEILPVVPAGHVKVHNRFRYQFLIKGKTMGALTQNLAKFKETLSFPREIRLKIDIDPLSTYF